MNLFVRANIYFYINFHKLSSISAMIFAGGNTLGPQQVSCAFIQDVSGQPTLQGFTMIMILESALGTLLPQVDQRMLLLC